MEHTNPTVNSQHNSSTSQKPLISAYYEEDYIDQDPRDLERQYRQQVKEKRNIRDRQRYS
jgi:hypothetical protein